MKSLQKKQPAYQSNSLSKLVRGLFYTLTGSLPLFFLLLFSFSLGFSQNHEIYVSDAGGFNNPPWQILKFDENGENPEVFINSNLGWPQDILFLEEQQIVLISNLNTGLINKHDTNTGAYIGAFASGIGGPTRMKIGADSLLYVLQWNGNGRVRRYALDGTYMGEFTTVGVPQSIGLDWDAAGNLYVSSYNGDSVRKYDTDGADLGLFINSNLAGPTNIWFDAEGDLLVVDYNATSVKRFDADGNYQGQFLTGLSNAEGVDFFPNGDILIGNGNSRSVKLFNSNGAYLSDLIPSGSGGLLVPNAVVLRDISTTSVEDITVDEAITVYPALGNTFFLDANIMPNVSSVEIYDAAGRLIEQTETITSPIWKAETVVEGTYFIQVKLKDGSVSTATVIVDK